MVWRAADFPTPPARLCKYLGPTPSPQPRPWSLLGDVHGAPRYHTAGKYSVSNLAGHFGQRSGKIFSQLAFCGLRLSVSQDTFSRKKSHFGSYIFFIFRSWQDPNKQKKFSSVSSIHLCRNEPGFMKFVLFEKNHFIPSPYHDLHVLSTHISKGSRESGPQKHQRFLIEN